METVIFIPKAIGIFFSRMASILSVLLLFAGAVQADGTLSTDIRISSKILGYDLQYRVYLPEAYDQTLHYPVMFLSDGQNYLAKGKLDSVLDHLISSQQINPVVAVFLDPRDPDDLETNRRQQQFLCNVDFLKFYVDELIPTIEKNYEVINTREGRTIAGVSFGGTNGACFGLFGYEYFSGIAMQSPANHPIPRMLPTWAEVPKMPLKLFLSTGTPDDNTEDNRAFHAVLREKGYDMKYIEVDEGHNWDNWRLLLDDILIYYYGKAQPTAN